MCLPALWHKFDIFFISLPMSFEILIFLFHMIACFINFDSNVWTQKCDITRATYEHFDFLTRSCVCLPQLWHNFGIVFITRPLSFQISICQLHIIASSISFDSHDWTQNFDITQTTYEHFYLLMPSCVCLPQLWQKFSIFFITRPLSFQILILQFHMISWFISFDAHVWTQTCDITWARYEYFY